MHALSKFLPSDFDKNAAIQIIAGKGDYPKETAARIRALGLNVKLIAFENETEEDLWGSFAENDRVRINVGQLGKLIKHTKIFGSKYAIMAGQITPKRLFKDLKPDLKAVMILATLKEKNAETIFGAIGTELSKIGCELLDARAFLDDSVASAGWICGKNWDVEQAHLEHGLRIVRECARLDIGQSCAVAHGTVLAVEGFEGTDKMIERAGSFDAKHALFVKTVKPAQDYRFDVPVVGERTVRKLAESKIFNAAIESEKVIILQPQKVKKLAEELGVKIYGA